MYDELVKRLREADEKSMCGECGLNLHTGATKKGVLFAEAADAIEKLSNAGSIYGKAWTLGYDAGRDENRPRWIPVSERLPEIRKVVLITDGIDVGTGWMNQGRWNTSFADIQRDAVTHWMPLPQPPKEET